MSEAQWHISPIADQVAAGGVMMVEESLLTIGLFCWLFLKVAASTRSASACSTTPTSTEWRWTRHAAARAVAAGRGDELWERLRAGARPSPNRRPRPAPHPGPGRARARRYLTADCRKLTSAVISLDVSFCPKFGGITPDE